MTTACIDLIVEVSLGSAAAKVLEKVHFLIYKSEKAEDYAYQEDGRTWEDFDYSDIYNFFNVTLPDGEIKNALGSIRSAQRAVDDLVKAGLLLRRRRKFGISLSVNFDKLREFVGDKNFARYQNQEMPKMALVEKEGNSVMPNLALNTPGFPFSDAKSGIEEMPKMASPYNKESDSLKEDSKDSKDLSGAIASDDLNAAIGDLVRASTLELTEHQKTTLMHWIVQTTHLNQEFIDPQEIGITGASLRALKALVKKDVLKAQGELISRKMTDRTEPKSILMNLTYQEMGVEPPAPRSATAIASKPTDKPFWELCAAMHCWNDLNMHWRKYLKFADADAVALLNQKIKQTCLALEGIHEKDPIQVVELQAFVAWWHEERFSQNVPIAERMFPTSQDKIRDHFITYRVKYRANQHVLETTTHESQ